MGTMSMMGQFLLLTSYVLHPKHFTFAQLYCYYGNFRKMNYIKFVGHKNVKVEINLNLSNTNMMCISYFISEMSKQTH